VTLTGVECDQGMDATIDVIVHNSIGGNINATATQVSTGLYTFTIKSTDWTGQCQTMPIEYCTQISKTQEGAGFGPGTGMFAQDTNADGTAARGNVGHLRMALFDTSSGSCVRTGDDMVCAGTTCDPSSIKVTKFYDFDTSGSQNNGEQGLANWPFCLISLTDPNFAAVSQTTGTNGITTFSNLGPGTYLVTEGTADGTWTGTTNTSTITIDHCGQTGTAVFGNYCTVPSGGLTLGFWSNKNGNKIITSDGTTTGTGKNLLPGVVTLLNSFCAVNANGSVHSFFATNGYADFRTWLLGATATNMAYMLSAQLAALELDVNYGVPPNKVDGAAFDLCSHMTINALMLDAKNLLCGPNGNYTIAGNPIRGSEQVDKDCIDALNNNANVVPVTPCSETFSTFTCP
jgi:Prealbumin-like fold domain